jgi:hypothetical protein
LIVGNLGYANKLKVTVGICGGMAMQHCSATPRNMRSNEIGKIEELWCGGHAEQMVGRSEFVKKRGPFDLTLSFSSSSRM